MAILLACCMAVPLSAKRKILLRGQRPPVKRSIDIYPIQAFVEERTKTLLLEFTDDLGSLSVTVSDMNGNIVYTNVIEGVNNTSMDILLDPKVEGEFVLSITDGENELSGEFFIN